MVDATGNGVGREDVTSLAPQAISTPRRYKRAKRRTWTLEALDRDCTYSLWWNGVAFRWDISVLHDGRERGR